MKYGRLSKEKKCKARGSGLNERIGDQHFSAEITNNDVSPVMQLILQANGPYAL